MKCKISYIPVRHLNKFLSTVQYIEDRIEISATEILFLSSSSIDPYLDFAYQKSIGNGKIASRAEIDFLQTADIWPKLL
jgi:hypothetical protein